MSDLHPIFAAALAPHLNAQAAVAAATVYRPPSNLRRAFPSRAEADAYEAQCECWPRDLDAPESLRGVVLTAWLDMDERQRARDDDRADEVAELREQGLL